MKRAPGVRVVDGRIWNVVESRRREGRALLARSTSTMVLPFGRTFADLLLFSVTAGELALLFYLDPSFTVVEWIYLSQHLVVLGIALTRRSPQAQDRSLRSGVAVLVAYTYAYAQLVWLAWRPGVPTWRAGGLVLVTLGAFLSIASLLFLGRGFGNRPAWRGLATGGPYRLVRHPMYLSYVLADIGYNLTEWNSGTVSLVIVGWASLVYRILAEERILSRDAGWSRFATRVRSRVLPGIW